MKQFYIALALLIATVSLNAQNTTIVYVKKGTPPGGDGTSWSQAFGELYDALRFGPQPTSSNIVQIWVSGGVYHPAITSSTDRTVSFILKNNLQIYGGFGGTETSLAQNQHLDANRTFLSGDIGHQQTTSAYTPTSSGYPAVDSTYSDVGLRDNCYNVVTVLNQSTLNSIILNAVTVTGGFAFTGIDTATLNEDTAVTNQALPVGSSLLNTNAGGGLFAQNSNINISQCFFVGNYSSGFGGAVATDVSQTFFSTCTFVNNYSRHGGGAYFELNSKSYLTGCMFKANQSSGDGGGFYTVTFPDKEGAATGRSIDWDAEGQKLAQTAEMTLFKRAEGIKTPVQTAITALGFVANGLDVLASNTNDPQFQAFATGFDTVMNGWLNYEALGQKIAIELAGILDPDPMRTQLLARRRTQISLYNAGDYDLLISCKFDGNIAQGEGGAISLTHSNIWLSQSEVLNNVAGVQAGAIYLEYYQNSIIDNCLIHNNKSNGAFSAIVNTYNSATQILNCTIADNNCPGASGSEAIGTMLASHIKVANCILWNNTSTQYPGGGADICTTTPSLVPQATVRGAGDNAQDLYGITEIISSDIQGLSHTPVGKTDVVAACDPEQTLLCLEQEMGAIDLGYGNRIRGGVISSNPQFAGAYSLSANSICIDHGNNYYTNYGSLPIVQTHDFIGNTRIYNNGQVDMGAYEYNGVPVITTPPSTLFVNANIAQSGDGSSWANALKYFQDALAYVANNPIGTYTQVWVAQGTYYTSYSNDRTQAFTLPPDSVKYYGGFAGFETDASQRNPISNPTYLSGDIGVVGDSTDNAYHVFYNPLQLLPYDVNVDGFIITGGNANGSSTNGYGGGVYNSYDASPSFTNCIFTNNSAVLGGGAVYTQVPNTFTNDNFINNNTAQSGGAIYADSGARLQINGCTFNNNNAVFNGGAICQSTDVTTFTLSNFTNNHAGYSGGALYELSKNNGYFNVENCLFAGNSAGSYASASGGAIYFSGNGTLYNYYSTYTQNRLITSTGSGAAIYYNVPTDETQTGMIQSSIIWNNTINGSTSYLPYGQTQVTNISQMELVNSDVQGYPSGSQTNSPYYETGSINTDPLFTNPSGNNFTLQSCSPAVNTGSSLNDTLSTDLAGNQRAHGVVDMGAYEYQSSSYNAGRATINATTTSICGGGNIRLNGVFAGLSGPLDSIGWQMDSNDGHSYITLSNNTYITGSHTDTMLITNVPVSYGNNSFRCIGYTSGCQVISQPVQIYVYGPVIYVDSAAAPGGDGSSWASAFNKISTAVDSANVRPCAQLWVKKGTYNVVQAVSTSPSTDNLVMRGGVSIYGGFAGTETTLSQRNWNTNKTILDGNLGGGVYSHTLIYAGHYLYAVDSTAHIDGFTLKNTTGGAISINDSTSPSIANCTFTNNSGPQGTGINISASTAYVQNCIFTNNRNAAIGGGDLKLYIKNSSFTNNAGGGIVALNVGELHVNGCTFTGNSSSGSGGGIYCSVPVYNIDDCIFTNNSANNGGGLDISGVAQYVTNSIHRCTFTGNSAVGSGGGVYMNTAYGANINYANFFNCKFQGNSAGISGGGVLDEGLNAGMFDCIISGNKATQLGGGMITYSDYASVIGTDIVGNYCSSVDSEFCGAGLCIVGNYDPVLFNSVIYYNLSGDTLHPKYNAGTQVFSGNDYTPNTGYYGIPNGYGSCIQNGGHQSDIAGPPDFIQVPNALVNPTGGDLHLTACSPLINVAMHVGTIAYDTLTTDLDGNPRKYNNGVEDVGPYEFQSAPATVNAAFGTLSGSYKYCNGGSNVIDLQATGNNMVYAWYISPNAALAHKTLADNDTFSGTRTSVLSLQNISSSYNGSILYAIANSAEGCVVQDSFYLHVYPQVIYVVPANNGGTGDGSSWANAFSSIGAALADTNIQCNTQVWVQKGTYYPTTTNNRNISVNLQSGIGLYGGFAGNETALYQRNWVNNPTIISGDIGVHGDNSDNSNIVVSTGNAPVDYTAILDGFTVSDGNGGAAGGLYCAPGSSPTVRNCTFKNNMGTPAGGVAAYGNMSMRNCTFINNYGSKTGGGFYAGGSYFQQDTPVLYDCTFLNNHTRYAGGAVGFDLYSHPKFIGGVVSGNLSDSLAGGIYVGATDALITNVTISGNHASGTFYGGSGGGGALLDQLCNTTMVNCIVWNNSDQQGVSDASEVQVTGNNTINISNSDIEGSALFSGKGNMNSDPLFVNPPDPAQAPNGYIGDLHVQACSPIIDSGDNAAVALTGVDMDSLPRVVNSTVDIGGYEYQSARQSALSLPAFIIQDTTVCIGQTFNIGFADLGNGITYQWQTKDSGGSYFYNVNNSPYFNTTTSMLQVNPVLTTMNGASYRCVITSPSGCTFTTNAAKFSVKNITVDFSGIGNIVCNNSPTSIPLKGIIITNGVADSIHQWGTFSGQWMSYNLFSPPVDSSAYTQITYTYNDGHGCVASKSKYINVVPPIDPTLVTSTPEACSNWSVQYEAQAGYNTYQWSNGDSTSTIYAPPGLYHCTITDQYGCTATSPGGVYTQSDAAPQAVITPQGPTEFCQGGSVTLTCNSGTSQYYAWSTGVVSFNSPSSITVSGAGPVTVVTEIYYNNNQIICFDTSAPVMIVVDTLPVNIQITGAPADLCGKTAVISLPTGYASYRWTTTGDTTRSITISAANTYVGDVYDSHGCKAEAQAVVYDVTFDGNIYAPNGFSSCAGSVYLTNLGDQNPDGNTFAWYKAGNDSLLQNNTTPDITVTHSGLYKLVTTTTRGCVDTSIVVAAVADTMPPVNVTPQSGIVCQGQSISTPAVPNCIYAWSMYTGANHFTTIGYQNSIVPSVSDRYYRVNETDTTTGCTIQSSIYVGIITVTLTQVGNFCQLDSVQLQAQFNAENPAGFVWNTGDTVANIYAHTGGAYSIIANYPEGCSVKDTIIVNASPITPAVSIAVQQDSICPGTTVVLNASPINGGTHPHYQWRVNGIAQSMDSSVFASANLHNGDSIVCIMRSNSNCANGDTALSNRIIVHLSSSYSPVATITPPAAPACQYSYNTFSADILGGGVSPQYQWYWNGNPAGNGSSITSTNFQNGDVLKLTLTNNDACASPHVVLADSLVVSNITPAAYPTITLRANRTSVCAGDTVVVSAITTNQGDSARYVWFLNNHPLLADPLGTHDSTWTFVPNNNDVIYCTMRTQTLCTSTYYVWTNPLIGVTFRVAPAVHPVFSISTATDTVCNGSNVIFTANPSPAIGVYQWYLNDSATGVLNSNYTTTTLNSGDKIHCVWSVGPACGTMNDTLLSDTIAMTVQPLHYSSVSISQNLNSICQGENISITATGVNGGPMPVYQWVLDGYLIGSDASVLTYNGFNNGDMVWCQFTGSGVTCPVTSYSDTITLNINQPQTPLISITASQTTVCSGGTVVFTATASGGGNTPVYRWLKNGLPVGSNSSTYTTNSVANNDVISCLYINNDCTTPDTAVSNGITMRLNSTVTSTITISNLHLAFCTNQVDSFMAVATDTGLTPVYQWQVNGTNAGTNSALFSAALHTGDVVKCILTPDASCLSAQHFTSNSITVTTISPVFDSGVNYSYAGHGDTICLGGSLAITANLNGTTGYQFQLYDLHGPLTSPDVNGSFGVGSTDTFYVVTTDSLGCWKASPKVPLIAYQPSAAFIPSNNTLCPGQKVSVPLSPHCTYNWFYFYPGNIPCSSNVYNTLPDGYSGEIYVEIYDTLLGCSNINYEDLFQSSLSAYGGGDLCSTGSLTLGTSVDYGLTPDAYHWSTGATTASISVTTPGSYTVTATYNQGCTVTATETATTATETASVSISASQTSICDTGTITFTATATNPGSAPHYQWKLNGVNTGNDTSVYVRNTFNDGDSVTCTLTSNSPCVTVHTVISAGITISVSQPMHPSATISVVNSASCTLQPITFNATVSNAGVNPAEVWLRNNSNVGNGTTYTASNLNNGDTIIYKVTSSNTCGNFSAYSNPVIVAIAPLISTSVSISANSSTLCQGNEAVFTAHAVNSGTQTTYQWEIDGIPVGNNDSVYATNGINTGDNINCVVTGNAVCANPAQAISNTITMDVPVYSTPSVSIVQNNSVSCSNIPVSFTASAVNAGTTPNYQWQVNGQPQGNNSPVFSDSSFANGDVVKCIVTSSTCSSPPSVVSNIITIHSIAPVTPAISIAGNNAVCVGSAVSITSTSTNAGTAPLYTWFKNGVAVGGNQASYTSGSFATGDSIKCVLVSNAACAVADTVVSNTLVISVLPIVAPTVSISTGSDSICRGSNILFIAHATNGGPGAVYQWKLNGNNTGTNDSTYTSAVIANGDVLTCKITSNATCAITNTANSNAITMQVTDTVTPAITIVGNSIGCTGATFNFTAAITNGGTNPAYQWVINSTDTGTNSAQFSNSVFNNGDLVSCILTSNVACATINPVTSNVYTIHTDSVLVPAVNIAADINPACTGSQVTFTATPVNGGTAVYQWKLNGVNTGANTSTFVDASANNGDSVVCIMHSNISCAVPDSAISNAIVVTTQNNIAPSVTISASQSSICSGTPVTFTATGQQAGLSPSYQWRINGADAGNDSSVFVTDSLANGSQIVSCIISSSLSCASPVTATSNYVVVHVTPVNTPQVSISQNTVCLGNPATFTATGIYGGTIPTYQWLLNGAYVGTNTSSYINNNPVNGDVVSCVLTSNLSCLTVDSATSGNLVVAIGDTSSPTVSISTGSNGICAGMSATFTATANNGGTTPLYQWMVNGNIAGNNSSFTSNTLATNDIVSCVLISSSLCASNDTARSNSDTVTVNSVLVPSVTISTTSGTICSGNTATFTAAATNGGSSPVYIWNINGQNAGGNNATYSSTSLTNNSTVKCTLVSSLVCATPDTVSSNAIAVSVDTFNLTHPQITLGGSLPICQGDSIELSAPTGSYNYAWSNSATVRNIYSHSNGTYRVTLTDANNCSVVSDSVRVVVNPLPTAPVITRSGNVLTSTASTTYQWYLNGNAINGATQRTITVTQSGTYTVEITDANGCTNRSAGFTITGLTDITNDYGVKLYPNPNNGSFIIEFTDDIAREIEITDALGRVMATGITVSKQKDITFNCAAGVYFLMIKQNDRFETLKFTVVK